MKKEKELENRKNVLLFWSGDKDSAVSLFELKSPEFHILGLLCFFDGSTERLQTQDVERSLIEAQAQALELPLYSVFFSPQPSNAEWIEKVGERIKEIRKTLRVDAVAFGDVQLGELRKWRELVCDSLNLEAVFPISGWSPQLVQQAFFGLGHQAIVHCLDTKRIPPAFLGRPYNSSFVRDLPPQVDPGGENGEFQTFVLDGPFFSSPLILESGALYEKNGFSYRELRLTSGPRAN